MNIEFTKWSNGTLSCHLCGGSVHQSMKQTHMEWHETQQKIDLGPQIADDGS